VHAHAGWHFLVYQSIDDYKSTFSVDINSFELIMNENTCARACACGLVFFGILVYRRSYNLPITFSLFRDLLINYD
jgi:hypothetical protein